MKAADATQLSPRDIVGAGLCIGCGSCAAQSRGAGARVELDRYGHARPVGPGRWLAARSAEFAQTCPFSPAAPDENTLARELFPTAPHRDARIGRFVNAYVGHVVEPGYRADASSGGLTSWLLAELLRLGLVDAAVHVGAADPADGRLFRYRISQTESEVRGGAKSRYYPVDLVDPLRLIRENEARYVITGVPCFVKALQLLRRRDPVLRERIAFTVGLFCGHMKSARFVESIAWQLGVDIGDVVAIDFRAKDDRRPANWYRASLTLRDGRNVEQDWWDLVDGDWGSGFFQNSACNWCDDVVAETADVSTGDAWVEPYTSDGRGTNVVVVRTRAVDAVLTRARREGRLALDPVDAEFVARTQAAALRQRREGLAYRLTWRRRGLRPRKRVLPSRTLPRRRKAVYRLRTLITWGSVRAFWLARRLGRRGLYTVFSRAIYSVYEGIAYSRGKLARFFAP